MPVTFHVDDVLNFAASYTGDPFHALFCDPPYHLTRDGRKYKRSNAGDGAFGRHTIGTVGFMGQEWDGGDVAFRPETWAAFSSIMYDGAFGLAFAGARGWHRQAVAIEDAGFLIHPSIFLWAFGSGFPKATRVDTQIDRDAGAERETIKTRQGSRVDYPDMRGAKYHSTTDRDRVDRIKSLPATDLAKAFENHRYGLQALKPAVEPIILFQKPYASGRPIESIVRSGAGSLNIGETRIGDDIVKTAAKKKGESFTSVGDGRGFEGCDESEHVGRWPSNLVLNHAPECRRYFCVDDCPVRKIKLQSDGADEFFFAGDWNDDRDDPFLAADPIFYCAKAPQPERDAGINGDVHLRPTMGNGIGATPVEDREPTAKNSHPTVKPLTLCRYLAKLLLPPPHFAPNRRILVPFSGSGSESIAAMQAGWDSVVGIEQNADYVEFARSRVEYWERVERTRQNLLFE